MRSPGRPSSSPSTAPSSRPLASSAVGQLAEPAAALVDDDGGAGLGDRSGDRAVDAAVGGDEHEVLGAVDEDGARAGGEVLERHDPGDGAHRDVGPAAAHLLGDRPERAVHVGVADGDEGDALAGVEVLDRPGWRRARWPRTGRPSRPPSRTRPARWPRPGRPRARRPRPVRPTRPRWSAPAPGRRCAGRRRRAASAGRPGPGPTPTPTSAAALRREGRHDVTARRVGTPVAGSAFVARKCGISAGMFRETRGGRGGETVTGRLRGDRAQGRLEAGRGERAERQVLAAEGVGEAGGEAEAGAAVVLHVDHDGGEAAMADHRRLAGGRPRPRRRRRRWPGRR